MKQFITREQWDELSEDAKIEIHKKSFTSDTRVIDMLNFKNINIGWMIEFLDENERWLTIERLNNGWSLFEDPTSRYDRDELVDSLWKAVKDIVNNREDIV